MCGNDWLGDGTKEIFNSVPVINMRLYVTNGHTVIMTYVMHPQISRIHNYQLGFTIQIDHRPIQFMERGVVPFMDIHLATNLTQVQPSRVGPPMTDILLAKERRFNTLRILFVTESALHWYERRHTFNQTNEGIYLFYS